MGNRAPDKQAQIRDLPSYLLCAYINRLQAETRSQPALDEAMEEGWEKHANRTGRNDTDLRVLSQELLTRQGSDARNRLLAHQCEEREV